VGSVGGLIAIAEGNADIAGTHLLDEATGEYNLPFVKRILPGREIVLVNLVYRVQGLMFAAENPKQIAGLSDLQKSDIVFINRQKGSGTRVLLDMQLKRMGITIQEIKGYDVEADTHLAVGLAIAQGKANTGLGIEAAARSFGLGFLPLFKECYDLAIPEPIYRSEILAPFLDVINSDHFKRIVNKVDGYDTSQTGRTTFIS
jgi:putative molybdopterin biosynthesis protein